MNTMDKIRSALTHTTLPSFRIGDTVKVSLRVLEGEKERTQVFEGVVIARRGIQNSETFTVRKISYGVGVERIFPLHSPIIQKIQVAKEGSVRRAKLYYLRGRTGKTARIAEKELPRTDPIVRKEQETE